MTEPAQPPENGTHNELPGAAQNVVQARDIHGGVHFHRRRMTRWGVVVAAVIVGIAAAMIRNGPAAEATCGRGGTLSVTTVTFANDAAGNRVIRVNGRWVGPPLGGDYAIYAIARPASGEAVGGTIAPDPYGPGRPTTRNWYVAGSDGLDAHKDWNATITVDSAENRPLVVQAICAQICPPNMTCGAPHDRVLPDIAELGAQSQWADAVSETSMVPLPAPTPHTKMSASAPTPQHG